MMTRTVCCAGKLRLDVPVKDRTGVTIYPNPDVSSNSYL